MGSSFRVCVISMAALSLVALWYTSPAAAAEKPNLLVFIADDMAWDDSGAYGHPHIRTPNLDRLAAEGLRFDQAFLTCSSCSPSRCSILSGRYPHNTGAEQLHWPLPEDQVLVSQPLRSAGYWTAAIGKWHLGDAATSQFDVVDGKLPQWQKTMESRPADQPFFVWCAFTDPHRPYQPGAIDQPHTADDVTVPPYLPDVPATRDDLAMYYDEIARLDGVVGQVLEWLNAQQLDENTFVLFISDNGRPFPRCKTTVYDSGIRTPFIVRMPGVVKPGSVCRSLVSSLDVAPTLLDLAGVAPTGTMQGLSFRPLLSDPQASIREQVFAEHNWHDYTAHERAVRTARYKYIWNAYPELPGTPPADAVGSPTYVAMRQLRDEGKLAAEQQAIFAVPRPQEELYDVLADPHELRNLAGDPQYASVLGELRDALKQWRETTRDGIPRERTPDGFDRETGERLPHNRGPRLPQPGQRCVAREEE